VGGATPQVRAVLTMPEEDAESKSEGKGRDEGWDLSKIFHKLNFSAAIVEEGTGPEPVSSEVPDAERTPVFNNQPPPIAGQLSPAAAPSSTINILPGTPGLGAALMHASRLIDKGKEPLLNQPRLMSRLRLDGGGSEAMDSPIQRWHGIKITFLHLFPSLSSMFLHLFPHFFCRTRKKKIFF
jgi:hypothetical protein